MNTRHNSIQVVPAAPVGTRRFCIVRPGARYAVHRVGDARPGAWVPLDEPIADGWVDTFPEDEARCLLPFLRARRGGRRAAEPTTPDGRLIDRACKRLGLTATGLGDRIGAHVSVLSRARHGELPEVHRKAIKDLLGAQQ